jgi:hypothetical protein
MQGQVPINSPSPGDSTLSSTATWAESLSLAPLLGATLQEQMGTHSPSPGDSTQSESMIWLVSSAHPILSSSDTFSLSEPPLLSSSSTFSILSLTNNSTASSVNPSRVFLHLGVMEKLNSSSLATENIEQSGSVPSMLMTTQSLDLSLVSLRTSLNETRPHGTNLPVLLSQSSPVITPFLLPNGTATDGPIAGSVRSHEPTVVSPSPKSNPTNVRSSTTFYSPLKISNPTSKRPGSTVPHFRMSIQQIWKGWLDNPTLKQ